MSKRVSLIVTDDLDGSENAHTVSFGLDGVSYEIDLSDENRAKLEEALAPFIRAGRGAPRGSRRRQVGRPGISSVDPAAMRTWARSAGLKVSERGRIGHEVVREYEAFHYHVDVRESRGVQIGDLSNQNNDFNFGLGGDQPGD